MATVHCRYTYSLHISPKMRGFYIPSPGKEEPGYLGVVAHEQKGANSWETHSCHRSDIHEDPARIIKKSQNNLKDRGEGIKVDKGAHQKRRIVLVALDSGEDLAETVLRICWTCFLCLNRMKTMVPLAQSMSPKHSMSGSESNTAYNESVVFS